MRQIQLVLMVVFLASPLAAQDVGELPDDENVPSETAEQPLDFWMQKKLDYSGGILRGLSLGDFDLIEMNANQMRLLNKIEGFVRSRHEGYRGHVRAFERVTEELMRQARKENIDGVTLAYHQLTVSCVRCHQSIRESDFDEPQAVSSERKSTATQ